MAYLKKIRVIVSLLFIIPTSILFLDFIGIIPNEFYDYLLFLQFIPSVIQFVDIFKLASLGFLIVLILVIFFGRVYCSSICPIGTLQDIISNLSKKITSMHNYNWSKELKWLRYSILIITILTMPIIGVFLLGLLDPFSNFGRIMTNLIYPLGVLINNLSALLLESLEYYIIYPVEIKEISIAGVMFSMLILTTLLIMSYKKGRLFCNSICPLGTLFGLISRVSLFKIKINEDDCNECGICETICKSECIEPQTKEINYDRCVVCFNCINKCPTAAINFQKELNLIPINRKRFNEDRRKFIGDICTLVSGISGIGFAQLQIIPEKESTVPVIRSTPVTPPGSKNFNHFTFTCTACHLCISVCPTKVIQPSILHYGLIGFLLPRMDYKTNYCTYECVLCMDVCPTGALETLSIEDKKQSQLGKSTFVKENCIVETEKKECGACSEHCPTKAVKMIPYEKNLHIPEITNDYCVGCGACEYACPTIPYKAIYVEGNPEHLKAKKPPSETIEQEIDYKEQFPF